MINKLAITGFFRREKEINYQKLDDKQLLYLITNERCKEALSTIVERYSSKLKALVYNVVRNTEDTEEIVQDVFMKVFQNNKFRGDSSFKTYITRVAINCAIDYRRSNERRNKGIHKVALLSVDEQKADTVDTIYNREKLEQVSKLFEQLSFEHRQILHLREIQSLSYEEIGQALDLSVGTVMSRLHYARKQWSKIVSRIEE